MKTIRIALVALFVTTTSLIATSPANAGDLTVLGAKLSWSDKMYKSDGCSRYDFEYLNGTGIELLSLAFELNDPYGRNLTSWSEVGIKPNTSGTWNRQICSSAFTNGLGPYIIKLTVKDFNSNQRQDTKEIFFLTIPTATPEPKVTITATPSPAPTVYLTNPADKALSNLVATLTTQVNSLNSKLKKICSVKPKPKGC